MAGLRGAADAASAWGMLIGHREQMEAFAAALAGGRLHHAWLLAGPEGVGKRTFADMMAARLLGDGTAALVAAGSHPDYRVLQPPVEGKGATQKIIPVDQVREIRAMLHEYPAMGGWRVIIVDPVDAMERPSANALLKELEEPAENTLFFLISHAPGRLLPTIRSRCRTLRFGPLGEADMRTLCTGSGVPADAVPAVLALAGGAPGRALAAHALDLPALDRLARSQMRGGDRVAFARQFQAAGAVPRFEALLRLVPALLAEAARDAGDARLITLYDAAMVHQGDAIRLAFDRGQVAFALASLLAEAGAILHSVEAQVP